MNKFKKLLSLVIFLILFNSCAKPTVVDVVVPGDNDLNCEELKIAVEETEELKIVEQFLPEQLSKEELSIIVQNAIQELDVTDLSKMGLVMKTVLEKT